MKNFDTDRVKRQERDRSFVIGGKTFTHRASVAPEAILDWSKMVGGEYLVKDDNGVPILDKDDNTISTLSETESLEIYDKTVIAFLEPGQEEKWAEIRNPNAELPLSVDDLVDVVRHLFKETAGRPTGQPSDSTDGSEKPAGTTSTDSSRSTQEPVAA